MKAAFIGERTRERSPEGAQRAVNRWEHRVSVTGRRMKATVTGKRIGGDHQGREQGSDHQGKQAGNGRRKAYRGNHQGKDVCVDKGPEVFGDPGRFGRIAQIRPTGRVPAGSALHLVEWPVSVWIRKEGGRRILFRGP